MWSSKKKKKNVIIILKIFRKKSNKFVGNGSEYEWNIYSTPLFLLPICFAPKRVQNWGKMLSNLKIEISASSQCGKWCGHQKAQGKP